jgi:hypothetical protein
MKREVSRLGFVRPWLRLRSGSSYVRASLMPALFNLLEDPGLGKRGEWEGLGTGAIH